MLLDRHYQNAYVTADVDAAAALLVEQYGAPEPRFVDAKQVMAMPDGEGLVEMRIAFIQVGALQYELIQPIAGPVALYRDYLPADGGMRLHHVAMRIDDVAIARDWAARQGRQVMLSGKAYGVEFLYIDARDMFGHYLEYVSGQSRLTAGMAGKP